MNEGQAVQHAHEKGVSGTGGVSLKLYVDKDINNKYNITIFILTAAFR